MYPEFKGYHADVRHMKIFSKDADSSGFSFSTDNEGLYVRLFTPEDPDKPNQGEISGADHLTVAAAGAEKKDKTMVKFPDGDISFFLSIPPIRSYKPLEQQGPQSQPDVIRIKPDDDGFYFHLLFDL